jgi:hypothetical protein
MDDRMTYDKTPTLALVARDTLSNVCEDKIGWTWTIEGIDGATVTPASHTDETSAVVKVPRPGTVKVAATSTNGVTNYATIIFDPLPVASVEIHVSEPK